MDELEFCKEVKMRRIPMGLIGLACMVAGGLLGASVALLVAPQSGRVTRTKLLSKGMEIKEKLADDLDHEAWQIESKIKSLGSDVRKRGERIGHDVQETIQQQGEVLKERVNSLPIAGHG
jgi:gas vesicle protein